MENVNNFLNSLIYFFFTFIVFQLVFISNYFKLQWKSIVFFHFLNCAGYYAFRRPSDGSWFLQALCSVLEKCDGSQSIMQLLTRVVGVVAHEYQSFTPHQNFTDGKKQTPCIYSMLTKDLYLKVVNQKGKIMQWC